MKIFEFESTEIEPGQRGIGETETTSRPGVPEPVSETKPEAERTPNLGMGAVAEPAAFPPISYDLSYSCLLIPRFHDHYLTGDITDFLVDWMRQICVSYGWRLDGIVLRPGYLHWVMTVPPTANPAQFMRLTRRHTSERIFGEFPRFKQKNMSGDFWAPGYFVAAGNQLQSPEAISNFILITRQQQGILI